MISKEGALRMTRERNLDIARKKLTDSGGIPPYHTMPTEPSFGEGIYANMEILNPTDKQKLKGFLSEAVASLQTIADEREHYKDIADRVEDDLGIDKKIFKKTAQLVHNGTLEEVKQLHEDADDLYSQISTVI